MKKEKDMGYYYTSDEYKEKLAEVEAQKALLIAQKEEEAKVKKKEQVRERNKLLKIFNKERCGEDNMHIVRALIDRAAFLRVELSHIEERIRVEGTMDFFVQGTQTMWREHPLSKVHAQHSKSYRELIKQLEAYTKNSGSSGEDTKNPLGDLIMRGNSARDKYRK